MRTKEEGEVISTWVREKVYVDHQFVANGAKTQVLLIGLEPRSRHSDMVIAPRQANVFKIPRGIDGLVATVHALAGLEMNDHAVGDASAVVSLHPPSEGDGVLSRSALVRRKPVLALGRNHARIAEYGQHHNDYKCLGEAESRGHGRPPPIFSFCFENPRRVEFNILARRRQSRPVRTPLVAALGTHKGHRR